MGTTLDGWVDGWMYDGQLWSLSAYCDATTEASGHTATQMSKTANYPSNPMTQYPGAAFSGSLGSE